MKYLLCPIHTFGHKGACKFEAHNGIGKMRPWDDVEEMNEDLVKFWNETVGPNDKVFHLGDVVINKRYLPILDRLNGRKVLIKGNHDIFPLSLYLPYFEDIRAYRVKDDIIMSHIPVHPCQKERYKGNIHGHLHDNKLDDSWYQCVSVEQIDYRPIAYDELLKRFEGV